MQSCSFLDWQEKNQKKPAKGALRKCRNYGMIATGNHCNFDSLRGAPRPAVESYEFAGSIGKYATFSCRASNVYRVVT
jgi:hypothetical protein